MKEWAESRRQVNTWLLKSDFYRLSRLAAARNKTIAATAREAIQILLRSETRNRENCACAAIALSPNSEGDA